MPYIIDQCLDDVRIPAETRLIFRVMARRLDFMEWRAVKVDSIAHEAHVKFSTTTKALNRLVKLGYLYCRQGKGRIREWRLPHARRPREELAKPATVLPLFGDEMVDRHAA